MSLCVHTHATASTWASADSLWKPVLSSRHVGLRDQTQVIYSVASALTLWPFLQPLMSECLRVPPSPPQVILIRNMSRHSYTLACIKIILGAGETSQQREGKSSHQAWQFEFNPRSPCGRRREPTFESPHTRVAQTAHTIKQVTKKCPPVLS